jgi:sugar phosphate isomerase/epimerase
MRLSVSVRIAEGFLSKEVPILPLEEVAKIASSARYDAICMRASQLGVQSSEEQVQAAAELLGRHGLGVSMVTGDFDTVYNNDHGPNALRNIEPYVKLAKRLNAPLVRVALKKESDIAAAQEAADIAAKSGVALVHQCHTLSLFETVDSIVDTLQRIDRGNFGLIYEPANLELCRQAYDTSTIERLAPWIFNVYLQNQKMRDDGEVTLETWCRGPVSFDIIPIHEPGGVDFRSVFEGLNQIGYEGMVTVHQSAGSGEDPLESTTATAKYLRSLM